MSDDEALRDVYARIMRRQGESGRTDAVSIEQMQAVLERRGPEADRVRTLDAIMRDQHARADFEILRAAYEAAPPRPTRTAIPYAIAAALVLVVGTQVWLQVRSTSPDTLRGSGAEVSVVTPGASLAAGSPLTFTWRRVPGATDYALDLVDTDGNVAYSTITKDTMVTAPATVRLTPERDYRWWVEANRMTGAPVKSPVRTLRIVQR